MATGEAIKMPKEKKSVLVAKSAVDLQRMKLEKLMEHPVKQQIIIAICQREREKIMTIVGF